MDVDLLQALAESSRLRIVELLDERPHTVGEVAAALELRQPQVTKHLQTLARAGVVTVHPLGQRRVCALERARLAELRDWLDGFVHEEASGAVLEEYRRAVDAETAAARADPAWAQGRRLRIERSLPVAPAALWPHWTEADLMREWWAPEHFSVADSEIDPRPGGVIRVVMQEGDGTLHAATGRVLAVSPPNELRFAMAPLGPDGAPLFDADHTIRFAERDAGTELSIDVHITSSSALAAPAIAGMKLGWQQALDKLEQALVT